MADLAAEYERLTKKARQANERRMREIGAIHDEIIRRYQPGGSFITGGTKLLEEQKGRETGKAMQQLISSGLYGTTGAAGLGRQWEAEVGAPARFKLEDVAMERLSSAQLGKASFLEGIQQPYPDYSALFQASQAQAQRPTARGGGGWSGMGLSGGGMRRFGYGGGIISGGGDPRTHPSQIGFQGGGTGDTAPQVPTPPLPTPPTPPAPKEEPEKEPEKPVERSPLADRIIEVGGQKRRLRYVKDRGWMRVG